MATIDEIRGNRLKKLKAIESAGFLVYPGETKRNHTCLKAIEEFSKLSRAKKIEIKNGVVRTTPFVS